jgi:hypothetical protein
LLCGGQGRRWRCVVITACVIVAVGIVILGLLLVASDFKEQRDWHEANAQQMARQLSQSNAHLEQVLNEHAACPAPYRMRGTW